MSDVLSIVPASDEATEPWTRREILQQPKTLRATGALLSQKRAGIEAFLAPLLANADLRIILAGAGTSAFIGGCLAATIAKRTGRCVEAVPTTDIVSAPDLYLTPNAPTLLVSFGRSGNSPESLAAIELADARVDGARHLIITCNPEGALARRAGNDAFVLVLPEPTHDRGFAMTSSFSAMMLSALAIFSGIGSFEPRIEPIARAVGELAASEPRMAALAGRRFSRVVYLGSGPLQALAREAALKLLELTDGALVTMYESTLGFRHGPKTIVNADTLVVVFASNNPLTRAYDRDLIEELRADGIAGEVLVVSAQGGIGETIAVRGLEQAEDCDLLFPYIVPAQLFAFHASLDRGLTPDQPNQAGTVNRVVQGVRIHSATR
ncbi:SIS domain-containing protein [Sphingomonas sp.]|uniref:SIS domain-containing protein n=1 Tax=Sphingomonas sp. TaxID=28214 RepID=UPI0025DFD9B2|nr:SIS domain-containing protein [Sphingomonas sp.]MBV9528492.1 SIS domain-containing protein [Sphingomonas sp.]